MAKLSIDQVEMKGKRVLVRVDFNVPLDASGHVTDDTRIRETLPTIRKIVADGGRAILMSHLGRPKGKRVPEMSLKPAATRLSELLGQPVHFADDCVGPIAWDAAAGLKDGEVLLLENLRFHHAEEQNDPEFAARLATLGDVYINDAFGSAHRAHASTDGVPRLMKVAAAGYLMTKELDYLGRVLHKPERPFVAILGGAKVSTKIHVTLHLLKSVDVLLIGGGMAFTFLKAQGREIGKSLCEDDKIDMARAILKEGENYGKPIFLPEDAVMVPELKEDAVRTVQDIDALSPDLMGVDIGPKTIARFNEVLRTARTVLFNGPMGVFEMDRFAAGTTQIVKTLAEITAQGVTTIVGGGDSAAAVAKAGYSNAMSHISTGGGASLEFMEGRVLPGVDALSEAH